MLCTTRLFVFFSWPLTGSRGLGMCERENYAQGSAYLPSNFSKIFSLNLRPTTRANHVGTGVLSRHAKDGGIEK